MCVERPKIRFARVNPFLSTILSFVYFKAEYRGLVVARNWRVILGQIERFTGREISNTFVVFHTKTAMLHNSFLARVAGEWLRLIHLYLEDL